MQTNMDKLRGKMAERKVTQEELAEQIGVDPSTFYRKMKAEGVNFTVGQMHKIVEVLNLSSDEAASIFLWNNSHYCEFQKGGT
jgi:transcriptional regulator with XRE-family HTH domain